MALTTIWKKDHFKSVAILNDLFRLNVPFSNYLPGKYSPTQSAQSKLANEIENFNGSNMVSISPIRI